MTSTQKDPVIYIKESQTQAEKRHGLNLMINLNSQRKNSHGKPLLHKSVHAMAEIFVTTGQTRLLTVDQLLQFIEKYPHDDMSSDLKRELLIQLSDDAFKETPVQRSPHSMARWNQQLEEQETDTEQGTQPERQSRSEVETAKPVSSATFRNILDDCIYGTDPTSNPEKESAQQEQILSIFLKHMDKLRRRHVTGMVLQLLFPKENIENQALALTSIFQSIDVKMHALIQMPLASNAVEQRHLSDYQGSLALSCLIRYLYGQGTTAIVKQEKAIQELYASAEHAVKDFMTFKKNVLTEWSVYDSLWQYFSTPSQKPMTERDKCESLLKHVAKYEPTFAIHLQREFQKKDSTFNLEALLGALEDQQRLKESLQIGTESSSPAKSGKGGGASSADKKGAAQSLANPAMQQQPKCAICGNEHDESKCPKEIDRLKKAAQKRGERLPGSDKSTKRDSQKESEEPTEMKEGCFMCFALNKPYQIWGHHSPERCFRKEKFEKKLEDPEQRTKLVEKIATKPSSARGNQTSERMNTQQHHSRSQQGERSTQSRQGSMVPDQQLQQAQMQHSAAMSREYSFPVGQHGQQYYMSQQPAGMQSEFVPPWQLFNSAQNSSQFYQPQGQQTMQRTAQVSQTMGPGFGGEAPQIQYLHHPQGTSPMVLQVSPQSQIFRNVDTRQMPSVSEQGMMSIGAQAGNLTQSPDRYSGSDSSSANTAVRSQPSHGVALLTQSLRNYLTSSPYSQDEGQQRGGQNVVVRQGSHLAMTAVTVTATGPVMDSPKPTMESFEQLPTWILQRFGMADIDPSTETTSSHLSETKKSALEIVEARVCAGEELMHPTITGVFGHVAGLGQCFIDTRNILNGVDECPKVTRNKMINDLISHRHQMIGWEKAEDLLEFEYDVKWSDPAEVSEFVSKYVDGEFQSGIVELLYAAQRDKCHYIVVSTVDGETTYAVTAIFPCYEHCSNNLKFLKAGVITLEELATPLMLFSHGGLINPHVLGPKLTHFAPIYIKSEVEAEDRLNQCLIVLEISPDCHKESSNLLNSIEVDANTVEKLLEDNADNRINELPTKMEQMLMRLKQRLVLYVLCMWKDEYNVSLGRKIIAEEKVHLKTLHSIIKGTWHKWKNLQLFSKFVGVFSKRIKSNAQYTMVRLWFATWKQSRDTKKRVKMQLRMNNVQSVVNTIMITKSFDIWKFCQQGTSSLMTTKFFDAWKFCQQGISRSNRFSQFNFLTDVMARSTMRLINHILRTWRHKVQSDLQLKQQSMRTPEINFASISRRHLLTETNHVGERPSIQGLQEGNLDLTRSFISPSTNARVKKSLSYVKAGALENKKIVDLLTVVLHGWYAISRSNSIKRYREIQLQSFTIRVMQQQAECSPRRAFRILLNSYFDQYLLKRYLQFWNSHYEMTHGITRSEMNNLFKKHTAKRIYRQHFLLWLSVIIRKNRNIQASKILERTYKHHLLEPTFAFWNKLVEMKIPCVEKFVRSSQMTVRTRLFQRWKNSSFEQKSLFQKIRFILRKYLFSWFKFAWENQQPTPAEQFRQSSRCADLQRALRDLLKQLQLNRLSPSLWLLLRRRGRLRTKAHDAPDEKQNDQSINNLQVVAYEAQAQSEARNRLQRVYETHHLGKIASETQDLSYLHEIGRRVPILLCGEIAKCCDPVTSQELQNMCFIVMTVMVVWWFIHILFVCAQTGGVKTLKVFPTTLTKCNAQEQLRVAMPASTKIVTAGEIRDTFVTRRSLFDTGTDAYLRQDDNLMEPLFPSSTVIHTAGPDQLKASHSGLLHLIVKDDKGNLHQLRLENALVVPNLSQNLTSHKQFVESGHMVFFHESQAGIVLNKKPKFSSNDIVIPFTMGENGLYYLEEHLPDDRAVAAMVAERLQKLTNAELVHISLCHVCPSLMRHLFRVTHLPKLRGLNDFRCHCCVEAKLKHAPKAPRSMKVITMPGELISCDIVGPFRVKSIHGKVYGLVFIDHCTNTPFNYAMKSKDEFSQYLQQFLIDFREMFKGYKVCEIQVLRSDNASELNSSEVQQILREHQIQRQFSCPYQQSQNGTAEKCIGDLWMMTKVSLLFSGVPRYLWDEAWFNAAYVKRHLPTTANEGFKSPLHVISGAKVDIKHILPFGSLLYIAREKPNIPDPKFDPRAQATVYLGHGLHEGRKCLKGYSFDFGKKGFGQIMYSTHVHSDPTYFPFRKKGEERVTSLSGGIFMSGKDKGLLEQEIPLPPEVQEWVSSAEMQYDFPESEGQQEQQDSSEVSEQTTKEASTPLENQIVGYNEAQDQYVVRSAGETTYMDSSELFQKVADGEKVFVEGVQGSIPGFSISFQDEEDMFIKKDGNMFVEHITVQEFKQKLDDIYRTTESPTQFYSIHDNIKEIIMNDLIREDEERMRSKDVWKSQSTYDRSFPLPEVLEHDKYPEEVHAYAARTVPNVFSGDELTLAQAKKLTQEWPLWLEAIKTELTSLIVTNEVFEPIDRKDVPEEKQSKIFNLLILLKRKRDQVGEITKHKARLVMDGSRAQIGVDVFDTYAPVIDYSTVRLLISLAFGNNWKMFHWDISVAFTNAKAEEETYVRFPKGFPDGLFHGYKEGTIARLKRNLYGSKSAPKLWYKCLHEVLIELGFKSVAGHPCLFIRITNVAGKEVIVVMGIFVDDLLVTGNSVEEIAAIQEKMKRKFVLTDQGELEYYLGVEVSKINESTLLLHQTGYAKKILERFKMSECKEVKTPLPRDLNLSLMDSPDEVDPILQSEYRAIIGSLMYLYQWTRPDLGFAVTFLSRYLHRPGEKHLQAAKHTLRYLKGTVGLGIRYTRDPQRLLARDQKLNVLYALSDSDFAGCKDTSRSTSGYMILMNGGVVAYYSGRQSTIALCTAMAETIALTKLVVKVKHMRAILFDLQCRQEQKTVINSTCVWVDNTAAIAVATGNDFTHETVKHVTVKVRFLQECVQRGIIMITYIKTNKNITDIMTKQSAGPQFVQHRDYALGIIDAITTVIAAFARVWRRLRFRV